MSISKWTLPLRGAHNPSSRAEGTTPGSFANAANVGGPLSFSSPDTPGMPAPSAKTAWDFLPDGWSRDATTGFAIAPAGFEPITQLEHARLGIVTPEMERVAAREAHLTPEQVRDEVAAGRMIIPANRTHLSYALDAMAIGRATKTKINANLGASPVSSGTDEEVEKMRWSVRWGADTVMDLSTGGDLDACREAIIRASSVPIGTVPIYSMIIGRKIEELTLDVILATLEHQARQGVDYFTIHAGVRRAHLPFVQKRLIGIVSRGGSLLAKWMLVHGKENPMYEHFEAICDVMRRHDVSFSLGDGLRPGGLSDASDAAQLAELETLGELTERAWRKGVQVMVEGPGHVPFDQIEFNMKLQRTLCHGAPFYVLGPLVTDVFPGYDHITSCIGATAAAYHGASMLCYVTPKEHVGLPKKDDVKQGCIAYKIAAHAADVALGIPGARDWDDALTKARAALNWEQHFALAFDGEYARALHDEDLDVDTDFCAMCGHDWCSVRISKEIVEFASGKAEGFEREKVIKSAALTEEQKRVLEQRGVLSPNEIHKLASKTRKAVDAEVGKGLCHSDFVEPEIAQRIQKDRLVQIRAKDEATAED
ncbi:phosphomethylpyrimidine synthase ThiC [Sandaracinus amylolyticus]|uniref:Phosphomethylpyrimidine synthase n=1 Tax=Sandaracinus amylolyticus TaxID=927083 RepID=A0A0F6W8V1_9BACT|nr:phosphomethylpyrimidine synthase ThiC [Sandaracinus amylolyticus]AKF10302.1 Hydroxymethylpyrimidine phosphate synthase ThiC [Sandaracinus amylolyticus]